MTPAFKDPFPSAQAILDGWREWDYCFANLSKYLAAGQVVYKIKNVKRSEPCSVVGEERLCRTIMVTCSVTAPVSTAGGIDPPLKGSGTTEPCDSELSVRAFGTGVVVIDPLVLLFKEADPMPVIRPPRPCAPLAPGNMQISSWRLRGIHSGEVRWKGYLTDPASGKSVPGRGGRPIVAATVLGRIAGTNSTGTYRSPALASNDVDPERCSEGCNAPVLQGRLLGRVIPELKVDPELKKLRGARVDAVYRLTYDPTPAPHPSLECKVGTWGAGVLGGVLMLKCR